MKNDKKILIIEQDGLVSLDLKHELEKKNFSVLRANSMIVSKIIISNKKADFVVANTNIQRQSFFDQLKILLKKCQIPFIWISTYLNNEVMKKNSGINVIETFSKPFISKDIVTLITNHFNKEIKPLFKKEKP